MKTLKPRYAVLAVAAALSAGAMSHASAAPAFTIDLSAILGGAPATYTGDFFSGTSTELLTSSGNTHSGGGWLQFSSLSSGAVSVVPFGTNAFAPLNLYVTFSLTDQLLSGAMNAPGSTYTLTSLDFVLWADAAKDTTFQNANAATNTPASVTGGQGNDIVLGIGSLISGTAGLTTQGGAYLNSINTFAVCDGAGTADLGGTPIAAALCTNDTGSKFFVDPKPFYSIAFTEFNNTAQGYQVNGNLLSINSASGGVDFNKVPEPGLLSLLGLGMAGIGLSVQRRKRA